MPRTPPIVLGRRFCSDCGRWRPVHEFGVHRWDDPIERTTPKFLRNICHHCERIRARVKTARLRGRDEPYPPRKPPMTPEERRRRHNERQKWRLRNDPEWAERYRERQRIWYEGKRRSLGVPRRDALIENRSTGHIRNDPKLPLGPFQEWIRERAEFYARREHLDENIATDRLAGIGYLAERCKVADRTLRRYHDGAEYRDGEKHEITQVPLGTVEHCLWNEGMKFIWEIYDEEETMPTGLLETC